MYVCMYVCIINFKLKEIRNSFGRGQNFNYLVSCI